MNDITLDDDEREECSDDWNECGYPKDSVDIRKLWACIKTFGEEESYNILTNHFKNMVKDFESTVTYPYEYFVENQLMATIYEDGKVVDHTIGKENE